PQLYSCPTRRSSDLELAPSGLRALSAIAGSYPHIGQGLHDVAQRHGGTRVADFEALDGEVDAIDKRIVVYAFGLAGQANLDVVGNRLQRGALLFGQRRVLSQVITQLVELRLQIMFRHIASLSWLSG